MNKVTKDIASLLKISLEEALKIQTFIEKKDMLDFSECSERKFRQVVRSTYSLFTA